MLFLCLRSRNTSDVTAAQRRVRGMALGNQHKIGGRKAWLGGIGASAIALLLSGCVTREQLEVGSVSINDADFSFNVELVYDEKRLGKCEIAGAQQTGAAKAFKVPLEPNSAEVSCTKGGKQVAQRVIVPKEWHSKIGRQRRASIIGGLVGGGVIAGAAAAIGGSSQTPIEKVPKHQRIYPPFVAVVPARASAAQKAALAKTLEAKYESYVAALPKDCDNWNRREMTALCDPAQIEGVKQFELDYVKSG